MIEIGLILVIIAILLNIVNSWIIVQYSVLQRTEIARNPLRRIVVFLIEMASILTSLIIFIIADQWLLGIILVAFYVITGRIFFKIIALREIDRNIILKFEMSTRDEIVDLFMLDNSIGPRDLVLEVFRMEYMFLNQHLSDLYRKRIKATVPKNGFLLKHAFKIGLFNKSTGSLNTKDSS